MQSMPAGVDPWWQSYGLPGVFLALTLGALGWVVRYAVGESRARERAREDNIAKLQAMVEDLHGKTLERLDAQRREFDERYQRLLERSQVAADTAAAKLHEQAMMSARALEAVAAKLPAPTKGARS